MDAPASPEVSTVVRPKVGRRAIAVVAALDLAIATAVGFGVYFATRRFGPPTPPRSVEASATICVPDDCSEITPTVSLGWTPPLAGGEVTTYVVVRDGEEVERLGPATTDFTDTDVEIGTKYAYEVFAIGDEGKGRSSPVENVQTPIPSIEHSRFGGSYGVRLVFRQIDLLTRWEGVRDPAVGDRAFQEWDIVPTCTPFQGGCNVTLFGWELVRDGRGYAGTMPSGASCRNKDVESTQTVRLRVTKARVIGRVLTVSAFTGVSEVDFLCGGEKVHAVAGISGALPALG
jgi:hypothetical protein